MSENIEISMWKKCHPYMVVRCLSCPDNTHCCWKDHCTAGLQFKKTKFDQKRKFVVSCMLYVESRLNLI